jgi:hypothetical protein
LWKERIKFTPWLELNGKQRKYDGVQGQRVGFDTAVFLSFVFTIGLQNAMGGYLRILCLSVLGEKSRQFSWTEEEMSTRASDMY